MSICFNREALLRALVPLRTIDFYEYVLLEGEEVRFVARELLYYVHVRLNMVRGYIASIDLPNTRDRKERDGRVRFVCDLMKLTMHLLGGVGIGIESIPSHYQLSSAIPGLHVGKGKDFDRVALPALIDGSAMRDDHGARCGVCSAYKSYVHYTDEQFNTKRICRQCASKSSPPVMSKNVSTMTCSLNPVSSIAIKCDVEKVIVRHEPSGDPELQEDIIYEANSDINLCRDLDIGKDSLITQPYRGSSLAKLHEMIQRDLRFMIVNDDVLKFVFYREGRDRVDMVFCRDCEEVACSEATTFIYRIQSSRLVGEYSRSIKVIQLGDEQVTCYETLCKMVLRIKQDLKWANNKLVVEDKPESIGFAEIVVLNMLRRFIYGQRSVIRKEAMAELWCIKYCSDVVGTLSDYPVEGRNFRVICINHTWNVDSVEISSFSTLKDEPVTDMHKYNLNGGNNNILHWHYVNGDCLEDRYFSIVVKGKWPLRIMIEVQE